MNKRPPKDVHKRSSLIPSLVCAFTVLVAGSLCSRLDAQTPECARTYEVNLTPDNYGFIHKLDLPAGVDEVRCQYSTRSRILYDTSTWDAYLKVFEFHAQGNGPFEAEVTFIWDLTEFNSAPAENPSLRMTPTLTGFLRPVRLDGGMGEWTTRHIFSEPSYKQPLAYLLDPIERPPGLLLEERGYLAYEIRMTLRRVRDRCFMHATVTGGPGAGSYSGDVAVLGNPTGVSEDTLDMWFGTQQGAQFQAMQDALSSQAGQQATQGATAEQMAQLQAFYRNMGAAAEQADPIREVREMLTLTLQDVMFDAVPPGSSMEAIMRLAGHFVLSAELDGAGLVDIDLGGISLPVVNLGVKVPGLGLASSNSDCGAPTLSPTLIVGPCNQDDLQSSLDLDEIGAVCGKVRGNVYNEQCEELMVRATFLAGRSIERCIR